jgi:hypothetical protein
MAEQNLPAAHSSKNSVWHVLCPGSRVFGYLTHSLPTPILSNTASCILLQSILPQAPRVAAGPKSRSTCFTLKTATTSPEWYENDTSSSKRAVSESWMRG